MDVLELPRPVINFLRTMAKEGCRYVLSWDIFGGTDTVTLTLTWKLTDDQSQLSKSPPQQQVYDDLHIRHNDSISSPRRSRRDENVSTPTIFRSSRGKSLEENNQTPTKQITSHQSQASSLERSPMIHRHKNESEPIYANLCYIKPITPSSPLNNNPSLSISHTNHRQIKQPRETSILRKVVPSIPNVNDTPSKQRRTNYLATPDDDDDDDILDPWVKRLEGSLKYRTKKLDDNTDKTEITSGKVKFKRKPDYF
jgi:hypothetical protein